MRNKNKKEAGCSLFPFNVVHHAYHDHVYVYVFVYAHVRMLHAPPMPDSRFLYLFVTEHVPLFPVHFVQGHGMSAI